MRNSESQRIDASSLILELMCLYTYIYIYIYVYICIYICMYRLSIIVVVIIEMPVL